MPQLKVENLYNTTITSVGGIPSSGDCDFTVAVAPQNTNGFIILSPDNPTRREIMYYHNVIGNRIYVRGENRVLPKAHIATETVKMNDVAEIFNTFSDMISQAFYVEKTGGLNVRVWGGYVYYNGLPVSVPDANLTMTDNTTNYIKYDYPSNTFSVDTVNNGNIKAQVVTLGGAITSIGYRTAKESYIDFTVAITGALPPQAGQDGKSLMTNGTIVYWGDPLLLASSTQKGVVEIATQTEVNNGTGTGATGAILAVSPDTLKVLVDSVKSMLANDVRLNTTITATGVGTGSPMTYYSSNFLMPRFGGVSITCTSNTGNPVSGGIQTSIDGISGWTDTGYTVTANNGGAGAITSSPIYIPIKGGVYVRTYTSLNSLGSNTATSNATLFY